MPAQILVDVRPLFLEHQLLAVHEVGDRDALDRELDRVAKAALAKSGQMQRRLTQGFRRDRSGVDARAARDALPLDQRDALSEIRGLRGAFFARGAGAGHDQVVAGHERQYWIREWILVSPSFLRPSRNESSITMPMPTSVAPHSRSRCDAAAAVPPVASTSSINSTRSCSFTASL